MTSTGNWHWHWHWHGHWHGHGHGHWHGRWNLHWHGRWNLHWHPEDLALATAFLGVLLQVQAIPTFGVIGCPKRRLRLTCFFR